MPADVLGFFECCLVTVLGDEGILMFPGSCRYL